MILKFLVEDMHSGNMHTEELAVHEFTSAAALAIKIAAFPERWHIINVWVVLA